MSDLAIMQLEQAPAEKPYKSVPISTQTFFSGLVTQRSPFNSLDNRYNRRFLGGRQNQLIDGLNVEVNNTGTLARRPGFSPWSNQTLPAPILSFYSFHQLSGNILVMADTATEVDYVTPTTKQTILTKSAGAGQTYFQGVGNTLYMGDGIDLQAWDGVSTTTRNWGIAAPNPAGSTSKYAGSATNAGVSTNWINPGNAIGSPDSSYATATYTIAPPSGGAFETVKNTNGLQLANYGFAVGSTSTISGIVVDLTGYFTSTGTGFAPSTTVAIQLMQNGSPAGTPKTVTLGNTPGGSVILGNSSDLWGGSWSPGAVNTGIGVQITGTSIFLAGAFTYTIEFFIDAAQITVYEVGSPIVTVNSGNGTLTTANGGWSYVFAYGDSSSGGISNPTQPSNYTGNFGGSGLVSTSATAVTFQQGTNFVLGSAWAGRTIVINGVSYTIATVNSTTSLTLTSSAGTQSAVSYLVGYAGVNVTLVASPDPQVNNIHVYRTKDGGATYFELPSSPYPNANATILDNSTDSSLNTLISWPSIPYVGNAPPPAGLVKFTYHLQRVWGVVGNTVYYSAGPDAIIGNGSEAFPPANSFLYPSTVNRLVPISAGLLVFTTDDTYIILGTSVETFYTMPFQEGVGLLSWNALDVQGSNIFLQTSDKQFLSLSSAGINEIGYAIGDQLEDNFDPSKVYVAAIIAGTREKAVYISDGSANMYRCNPNQPPEGGPTWSCKAAVQGGVTAMATVETSPGVHQLLIGQGGNILFRDSTTFTDNGTPYPAFATLGSLVLAMSGQLAEVESITLELYNRGTFPSLSVLIDEISGSFEPLPISVPDPPNLAPSLTVSSRRFYLVQGQDCVLMRHMQAKISFVAENFKNELLTFSLYGSLRHRD